MQVYWLLIVAIVAQTVRAEGDNWAENTASDPTAESCVWLDPVNSHYMPQLNRKQITKVDADACKKACEDETDFNCYSFDFNGWYEDCFLQSRDRYSVKLKASASYNVRYAKYYERNCRADYPDHCVWEAEMSGVLVSGNDLLTLTSKTVDECKKACEDESTFHCQSFDYHPATSKCFLSVASRYTTALVVHTSYSYYERNCQVKYQKCSGASPNVEWSDAWHAKYLPAPVLATMKMTTDDCKLACVQQDTFHCRSFEYTETSKTCALHAYNRQDYSDFTGGLSVHRVLLTHTNKNYYELIECPEEAKPQPVDQSKCVWLDAVDNYYLYGQTKKTITSTTVEDCQKSCEDETTFECHSFDFYKSPKICYLQIADRYTHRLSPHSAFSYHERNCKPYYPGQCEWEHRIGSYLSAANTLTIGGKTPAECKDLCESDITFHCQSFDYYRPTKICYLQLGSMFTSTLVKSTLYDYYGRNCRDEYRNCSATATVDWAGPWFGRYIPGIALKTISGLTRDECRQACATEQRFICTSFSYLRASSVCYLQAVNSETKKIDFKQEYTYDEIKSCTATEDRIIPSDNCTWVEFEGYQLPGNEVKTITADTPEDCQQECLKLYPKSCRSVEYIPASKRCYFQLKDRTQVAISKLSSRNYYEKQCPEFDADALCVWQTRKDSYLASPKKIIAGIKESDCQKACEEEITFICKSYNYVVTINQCQLSMRDLYGNSLALHSDYDYHERNCRPKFSSCNADSNPTWLGPFYGQLLYGKDLVVLTAISLEECKVACIQQDTRHCIAIEYMESIKRCILNGGNREDSYLINSASYNYYEIDSCPQEGPTSDPEPECTWRTPVEGMRVPGYNVKVLSNMDEDDCMEACKTYQGVPCLSVDYVTSNGACYLNTKNRDTIQITAKAGTRYHELDCSDKYTEQCEWIGPILNNRLGKYTKVVDAATGEDCKKICEDETTFNCVSFDYLTTTKKCYMAFYDRTDYKLIKTASWNFYERVCDNARRSCGTDEAIGSWADVQHGRGFGTTLITLTGPRTVDECKDACVKTSEIRCQSFDFIRASGVCYLNGKTGEDKALAYIVADDHYELLSCDGPLVKPASQNCTWKAALPGLYISGHDKKTSRGGSEEDCKKACEEETSFFCASFDYYTTTKICYFQSVDRSLVVTSSNRLFTYHERDCRTEDEKVCSWEKVEHAYLSGENIKTIRDQTYEKCQELCSAEQAFICKSFDYNFVSNICYLSMKNMYTGLLVTRQTVYDYYELNCLAKYKTCNYHSDATWADPIRGKTTSGIIRTTLSAITVDECKKACLQATLFHCRSFIFRYDNTCYLKTTSVSAGDSLVDVSNIDYYELESCSGAAPVAKPATECVWNENVNEFVLYGSDLKVLRAVTEEGCKAGCVEERTFQCNSADYYHVTRNCYLQTADRSTTKLTPYTDRKYFERDCSASYTEECSWTKVGRSTLSGYDLKTYTSQTVDECKENCEKETAFNCMSFDFVRDKNLCRLQIADRYYTPIVSSTTDDYYERNCNNAFKGCGSDSNATWADPIYGYYKPATARKTLYATNADQCKTACLQSQLFHCTAFALFRSANPVCYLYAAIGERIALSPNAAVEFYELLNCNEVPPVTCGKNMLFKKCGSNCRPTCADPDGSECSDEPCQEGCFCYSGMIYDGVGACIKPEQCGCAVPGSNDRMKVGEAILSNTCTRKCSCKTDGTDAECITTACQENEVCFMGSGEQSCQCQAPNYAYDGSCNAPPVCGDGMEFKKCASDCLPTCDDPEGTECSTTECVPKCTCKEGLVYNSANDTCVSPNELCGCLNPKTNKLAKIGERFLSDNCTKTCICKSHGADLKCKDYTCATNTVCQISDGVSSCVCEDPPNIFIRGQCKPRCQQPKKVGSCSGSESRFFFNKKKQRCRPLNYTGCGDNGNNFETKEACTNLCLEFTTPPECLLPKDEGPCDDVTIKYYFDGENCRKLRYGGCQGNANNFETKLACRNYCKLPPTS